MKRRNYTQLLHILLFILLSWIMWGCVDEHVIDIPINKDKENTITFSIKIPSSGIHKTSDPTTRALTEDDENEVNQIAVLLFDSEGNYTYQPLYSNNISTNPDNSQIKTFTIKVPEGTYDMVVLANSNQSLAAVLGSIIVGQPKAEVLNKLLLSNSSKWNAATGTSGYIPIPMWGEAAGVTVSGTPINVSVTLVRMVAKIDVALTTSTAKSKFNLESVRLYNYNDKGQIVPFESNWSSGTSVVTAPSIPATANKPTNPATQPLLYDGIAITEESGRGISCINEIYTFEALMGTSSSLSTNTCLVVGGKYGSDSQVTYYRIDFANTSDASTIYFPILRNHNYKANITDVKDSGLATPEDAFNSRPVNIETTVTEWNDSELSDVVFDGQYMFGVSQGEFIFTGEKRTAESNDNTLSITTDYPSGWKVEKIVDGSDVDINLTTNPSTGWLQVTPSAVNSSSTTDTKLFLTKNVSGSKRTGYIHIRVGRLNYIVKVEQKFITIVANANSHIVKPNSGPILIPVIRANETPELGNQLVAGQVFNAHLVWTDNDKGIAENSNIKKIGVDGVGPDGYLVVEAGSAQGNAVVAIRDANNKILWSWHIWVTDYAPTKNGTNTFMDRNLGAIGNTPGAVTTKGLLYQWGRKDPFPGSSTINGNVEPTLYNGTATNPIITKVGSGSLSKAVANPTNYYTSPTADWLPTPNDALWDNGSVMYKTIYDPCPEGWRVPRSDIWNTSGWDSGISNFGQNNSNFGGYYPAAGMRVTTSGLLGATGTYGHYWSATVSGAKARRLEFPGPFASVLLNDYPRPGGLSVRCVQE